MLLTGEVEQKSIWSDALGTASNIFSFGKDILDNYENRFNTYSGNNPPIVHPVFDPFEEAKKNVSSKIIPIYKDENGSSVGLGLPNQQSASSTAMWLVIFTAIGFVIYNS